MNGLDYKQYLASREWALKREAVRRRSGNKCERCKTGPQDAVHHLTYANVGNEPLEDLQAVCDPCHAFLSGKSDYDPAYKHPAEIACEEWEANRSNSEMETARPINYCRTHCENCEKTRIFVFTDIQMWDWPFEKFDNCVDSAGRYKPERFWLHAGQAYCDYCGENMDLETFAYLVRR